MQKLFYGLQVNWSLVAS